MNYEKAYKEALERAKGIHSFSSDIAEIKRMEQIFPELKESEDEKIRKALIRHIAKISTEIPVGALHRINGVDIPDILAWLEKQGNKPQGKTALEAIKEEKVDNAYKVEPKFKIEKDSWYVCIRDLDDNYGTRAFHKGDIYYSTKDETLMPDNSNVPYEIKYCVEDYFRIWTIADAKDGDVLCGYPETDYPWIGIFYKLNAEGTFNSYCYLQAGLRGKFCPPSGENIFGKRNIDNHSSKMVVLATKEQRDILFQKMKEAGYEWDGKKKELKKIK